MVGLRPAAPLVVINPNASRLTDPARRERVARGLVRAIETRTGRTPIVVDSTAEAARAALARSASSPLVAVAGGDGTIREALTLLEGTDVPIAIVPAGTGNVFASALGIPRRVSDAISLIGTGRSTSVDLGSASWGHAGVVDSSDSLFAVACGVGFDARVMAAATVDLKRRLGFLAYVVAALTEGARLRPVRFRLDVDGEAHSVEGLVILVANCGQLIPGVVGPRQPIDPTDGQLDVIVITGTSVASGLLGSAETLLAAGPPPHHRARSLRFRARRVRVEAHPPEPLQVDGDAAEADWLEATVLPGAAMVIRP